MKKILLFLIALTLGFGVKAQCPLTTAVDFTVTDVHGSEVHLFDILDNGQYVLLDFFFTTCSACIQTIPYMVQSYQSMGCNMHDVFYMEVDTGDDEEACLNWTNNHSVEYPTIAGDSGGTSICNQYGIGYYPTIILIAPDHSIVIQDLWPISNAQSVISALEAQGLEQHDCNSVVYEETLTFDTDTLWVYDEGSDILTIYNNTAEPEVHLNKITINEGLDWFYFTYGNQEFSLNEEIDIPIAQGENIQLGFHFNVMNKEMYYPVLSFENTLETVTLVTAFEWFEGVQEAESLITLFPNPANESVTLKGENLGLVSVYNALGQKMDECHTEDDELNINTTRYPNGVYFIKNNEKTLRFVVNH